MSDASYQPDEPDLRRGRPLPGIFTLGAIGAFAAAAYWSFLTFLIGISGQSTARMILPFVIIGLYGYRGYQLLKGNVTAASNLMWLHGLGAAITVYEIATSVAAPVLLGVKVAIHVFGLVTALLIIQKSRP